MGEVSAKSPTTPHPKTLPFTLKLKPFTRSLNLSNPGTPSPETVASSAIPSDTPQGNSHNLIPNSSTFVGGRRLSPSTLMARSDPLHSHGDGSTHVGPVPEQVVMGTSPGPFKKVGAPKNKDPPARPPFPSRKDREAAGSAHSSPPVSARKQ